MVFLRSLFGGEILFLRLPALRANHRRKAGADEAARFALPIISEEIVKNLFGNRRRRYPIHPGIPVLS